MDAREVAAAVDVADDDGDEDTVVVGVAGDGA